MLNRSCVWSVGITAFIAAFLSCPKVGFAADERHSDPASFDPKTNEAAAYAAARLRKDAYCARFNAALTPALVAESEATLSQLNELNEQELASARGAELKAVYFDQLERIKDANANTPIDCMLFASLPSEIELLAIGVRLVFVTDRKPETSGSSNRIDFGTTRLPEGVAAGTVQADLHYGGRCKESEVQRTWIWNGAKPARVMLLPTVVGGVKIGNTRSVDAEIRKFKNDAKSKRPVHAVVFVHGFNVTFEGAVSSAAEIANCMKTDVLPVVVSWPSAGAMASYLEDEESVSVSRERMRTTFRWLLSQPDIDEITLVAHSMGTRLVTRLLADLNLAGVRLPKLSRVVLAAADLGEEEFSEFWPRIRKMPAKGWTFYVSNSDLALWASGTAHRRPRLGDSRKRTFTIVGADTVDASTVAPLGRGYGHSYVIDSLPVAVDVRGWVTENKKPKDRGLKERVWQPANYWDMVAP